jgi:hypothetical protein
MTDVYVGSIRLTTGDSRPSGWWVLLARVRKLRKSLEKNSMAEMTGEEGARGR